MVSLPFIWASGSSKRTFIPVASSEMSRCGTFSAFSASSMIFTVPWSMRTFDLLVDTCTAGTSGKKFGVMYRPATTSKKTISRYFHIG